MNPWTLALIVFCGLGLLLAIASCVAIVAPLLRVKARVEDLRHSRLAVSLQSIDFERTRFQRLGAQAAPLLERAQQATASIRESAQTLRLPDAKAAVQKAGADIAALIEDLR